jgi:hypothetical protein
MRPVDDQGTAVSQPVRNMGIKRKAWLPLFAHGFLIYRLIAEFLDRLAEKQILIFYVNSLT